jgi:hypothetical protein
MTVIEDLGRRQASVGEIADAYPEIFEEIPESCRACTHASSIAVEHAVEVLRCGMSRDQAAREVGMVLRACVMGYDNGRPRNGCRLGVSRLAREDV